MNNLTKKNRAFTLVETLATLIISAMIMIAVLGVYSSVKRTIASIDRRLERYGLPTEILQRIAEDLDRMLVTTTDVKITFNNKGGDGSYSSAQLIIESMIYDTDNQPQTFEKIVWQSQSDPDANGLILYRAHSGYTMEDHILDEPKAKYARELFIPICEGLTYFRIQAVLGEALLDKWDKKELPTALAITLSFAEAVENLSGEYEVPEEERVRRTIAVDRTRQIPYVFEEQEFVLPIDDEFDSNDIESEPNDLIENTNDSRRQKR